MSDDFSFNGLNASAYYFEMGRYFDGLLAKQKANTIEVPKIPGFTQLSKSWGAREIPVTGVLYAPDKDTLLTRIQAFKSFLYYDTDRQLIFNDNPNEYYNAQYLDNFELNKKYDFTPIELIFTCNDPFKYAVTPDDDDENAIVNRGHTWTINNGGDFYSWPIITVTFHQSQTHIYIANNNITGDRFDITKAFVNNDVLVIDSKTERITLNSVYAPAGFGDGGLGLYEFIILNSGNNLLEIGTDDATINVDVNVWFRKTYK